MTELEVLVKHAGMEIKCSESGIVRVQRRFDRAPGEADIQPVIYLELLPGIDIDKGSVELNAVLKDTYPQTLVYSAPTLRDALKALGNDTFLLAVFWAMATDMPLNDPEAEAELIINTYATIPDQVDEVRDDQDMTLAELSDLTLALLNISRVK